MVKLNIALTFRMNMDDLFNVENLFEKGFLGFNSYREPANGAYERSRFTLVFGGLILTVATYTNGKLTLLGEEDKKIFELKKTLEIMGASLIKKKRWDPALTNG
jgi:hypothetical protein